MKRFAVCMFVATLFLLPSSALCLAPWIEFNGSSGAISKEAFSDDLGLRGAVGVEVCSGIALGVAYERLSGEYTINSTYFFLEESRSADVFSVFVQTRMLEKTKFSLWHGLAVGWLENDSSVSWMTYGENKLIDSAFNDHDVKGTSTTLETWVQARIPVNARFSVSLGAGMRFLGIEDLSGAEKRALGSGNIDHDDSGSASDLRLYFRIGAEIHF